MNIPNPAAPVNELLKQFYTIKDNVLRMKENLKDVKAEASVLRADNADFKSRMAVLEKSEEALRDLKSEVTALRSENSEMKARLAVLEEGRKTVDAQTRAVVAETVADLKSRFAEVQADIRIQAAQAALKQRQTPSLPPDQD